MPSIIDYPIVLEHMRQMQMRSLYHNSGAFGFSEDAATRSLGWIGPPDGTIKESARPLARQIAYPFEKNLVVLLTRAWREILPGRIWIMPKSHWAYELEFGSGRWMPALLKGIGIDPKMLRTRTSAAAIEFAPDESGQLKHFVARLLEMLQQSDFSIAFPNRRVICELHHHKQLWWTGADLDAMNGVDSLLPAQVKSPD